MSYGFLKTEHQAFPPIVHVETTNACNFRCIHCPHTDVKAMIPNYQAQTINFDLWCRVVDEVAQHPAALRLTPDGEPMLLKDWVKQVQYAQDKGVQTFTFNTHGMFLEGDKAEILLRSDRMETVVEVSLDALYPDTYERIRVRGDYPRTLRNILNFIEQRNRLKRDNVKVMVSIVVQPEVDEAEVAAFDRFWSSIADKVIIRNYVDTKGLTPKKNIDERRVEERWPCVVVFTRLIVTWDGRIRFCPDDWLKTTTLMTLDEAGSLQAVWQSEAFNRLRKDHLAGRFTHPTCHTCTDWKTIRWGKDYTAVLASLRQPPLPSQPAAPNLDFIWHAARDGQSRRNTPPHR